jgi:hypothetical protein
MGTPAGTAVSRTPTDVADVNGAEDDA